ncbi:hypothetical protein HOLleu_34637 [Holothuria leucospilota]|uniref:C-type lectin domain-containing protein n=1 Tax=Holothuria leucospilota TaxID=206669 RepID=A0A9Q0YLC1_HOLLE|nr:hypothetical protein HOLleu_34637 [Holothuria leucospilota]
MVVFNKDASLCYFGCIDLYRRTKGAVAPVEKAVHIGQNCSDLLDGRIYRFVLDGMSVSNATENCQSLNSSLVFIESEEEDEFVHKLVQKCAPDKGPWEGWTWIRNNVSDSGRLAL